MSWRPNSAFLMDKPADDYRTEALYINAKIPLKDMPDAMVRNGLCKINYGRVDRCRVCQHPCKFGSEMLRREAEREKKTAEEARPEQAEEPATKPSVEPTAEQADTPAEKPAKRSKSKKVKETKKTEKKETSTMNREQRRKEIKALPKEEKKGYVADKMDRYAMYGEVWKEAEQLARLKVSKEEYQKGYLQGAKDAKKIDRDKAYDEGFTAGQKHATFEMVKGLYAAVVIAMNDSLGFGKKRCLRVLKAVDKRIRRAIDNKELAEEAMDRTGIRINVDAVMDEDRIEEADG